MSPAAGLEQVDSSTDMERGIGAEWRFNAASRYGTTVTRCQWSYYISSKPCLRTSEAAARFKPLRMRLSQPTHRAQ